jgi:integrase
VKRTVNRWGKEQGTKTGKPRRVDLSDAALKELIEHRNKLHFRFNGDLPEWIFPNQNGNPMEFYNIRHRHFEKCLKLAGLPKIRFHDLRHTFASLMIRKGKSMKFVQQMLGHSSIKMTRWIITAICSPARIATH